MRFSTQFNTLSAQFAVNSVCFALLITGTVLSSYAEIDRFKLSDIRGEIINAAEEALNAALDMDNGKFDINRRDRFRSVFYEHLDMIGEENLSVEARYRNTVVTRVYTFITESLSITQDSSIEFSHEYVESVAKFVCGGLQVAMSREEPVPTGETRDRILQQAQEIKQTGIQLLRGLFPDVDKDAFDEIVGGILQRNVDRIDDPFAVHSKRILSDREIAELYSGWNRIVEEVLEESEGNRISYMFELTAKFQLEWSAVFRDD